MTVLNLPRDVRERLERLESGDVHLQSASEVEGYALRATDGDVGSVKDFLSDPHTWKIGYVIVDTGHWFAKRKVAIGSAWIKRVEWTLRDIEVALTRHQIEDAPKYDPAAFDATFDSDMTIYYKGLLQKWKESLVGRKASSPGKPVPRAGEVEARP